MPILGNNANERSNCRRFMELPTELQILIVRKCTAKSYVRLRHACKFMDEICETNRKRLGIHVYENPKLYLLNELRCSPFYINNDIYYRQPLARPSESVRLAVCNKPLIESRDRITFHRPQQPNFLAEMDRNNVERIRKSLSGFAFTSLGLINIHLHRHVSSDFLFEVTLPYVLEVIGDINFIELTVKDILPEQLAILIKGRTIRSIKLESDRTDMRKYLTIDAVKTAESISFYFDPSKCGITSDFITNAAKGRKSIKFECVGYPIRVKAADLEEIFKEYRNTSNYPDSFSINLTEPRGYEQIDFEHHYTYLRPRDSFHFGHFVTVPIHSTYGNNTLLSGFDIWINPIGEEKWRFVSIKRSQNISHHGCDMEYQLDTVTTRSALIRKLLNILGLIFVENPDHVNAGQFNYYAFEEEFETARNLEEIQVKFRETVDFATRLLFKQEN